MGDKVQIGSAKLGRDSTPEILKISKNDQLAKTTE